MGSNPTWTALFSFSMENRSCIALLCFDLGLTVSMKEQLGMTFKLTFESFWVDLLDEAGVDVSSHKPGLSDDVPQHWDVVVHTYSTGHTTRHNIQYNCQ